MESVKSLAIVGVLGLVLWWLFFRKKGGAAAAVDTSSGGGGDVITPPAAPPDRPVPTWQGPLPTPPPPPMKSIGGGPVLSIYKGGGTVFPRALPTPTFTTPPTVFKAPDNYFEKALHPPAAPVIPPTFAPKPTTTFTFSGGFK